MNLLILFVSGLLILVGSLLVLLIKNQKNISELSISLAFSVLLLLIFLELIPEALEHLDYMKVLLYSIIGLFGLKILDLFIPEHDHTNKKNHILHIGVISSVALVLHNIIEGMALYLALRNNFHLGLFLSIGIGLHNIPMGMVIASTLKEAKYSNLKIIIISFLISLSTLFGAFIIYLVGTVTDYYFGIMLSLTLGMIVYIVFFELLNHVKHQNKKNNSIGIIIGAILILISLIFHRH